MSRGFSNRIVASYLKEKPKFIKEIRELKNSNLKLGEENEKLRIDNKQLIQENEQLENDKEKYKIEMLFFKEQLEKLIKTKI